MYIIGIWIFHRQFVWCILLLVLVACHLLVETYILHIKLLYTIIHIHYFSLRSYRDENTVSRPICEVKHHWACLVLRWVTTGETHSVVSIFFFVVYFLIYDAWCDCSDDFIMIFNVWCVCHENLLFFYTTLTFDALTFFVIYHTIQHDTTRHLTRKHNT